MVKSSGFRRSSVIDRDLLIRRIQSSKLSNNDIDEIVEDLRSRFQDYHRIKTLPFKAAVREALEHHRRPQSNASEFDNSDSDAAIATPSASPHRNMLKRSDESEELLFVTEREHLRRRRRRSPLVTSSGGEDDDDDDDEEEEEEEEENGAVSAFEDVIVEQNVEPELDLMKSMLRAGYRASTKGDFSVNEGKNLEMEGIEGKRKLRGLGGIGCSSSSEVRDLKSRGGGEVKGKDGPWFGDLGGMQEVLDELEMEVIYPLDQPQVPRKLRVKPTAGILLHGPPGCGKTKLAHAIANEAGVPFYKISATEVVSGVSGASEKNIRDLFSKAYRTAPSVVFIDEIDAIGSKRESLQREMECRIVSQLITCMDEWHQVVDSNDGDSDSGIRNYVLVIGATNRPDALDPALRRRFDREILLSFLDENARREILTLLTSNLRLEGEFDLYKIARATPGFVGADLASLVNKAGRLAMRRIVKRRKSELSGNLNEQEWRKHPWTPEELEELSICMADFEEAAKVVQPSTRREGFSTVPNVKWEDVGGLDSLREIFDRYIVSRIKNPEDYKALGIDLDTGFLLYGPPGCGKTLIAKAVANEAGANFIYIKGPELLNKYVGESESAVRTIFRRARICSPCIIFFDEVDAITTKGGMEGGWVVYRLLKQLLTELDGENQRLLTELNGADQGRGVYVIGATNRPEVMDDAVIRPGRFGKRLYVPLPGPHERGLILKSLARKKPISPDVDLMSIGRKKACENLSGADLAALMNEAAMAVLDDKPSLDEGNSDTKAWRIIKEVHFDRAVERISPSISAKLRDHYEDLSRSFGGARGECLTGITY